MVDLDLKNTREKTTCTVQADFFMWNFMKKKLLKIWRCVGLFRTLTTKPHVSTWMIRLNSTTFYDQNLVYKSTRNKARLFLSESPKKANPYDYMILKILSVPYTGPRRWPVNVTRAASCGRGSFFYQRTSSMNLFAPPSLIWSLTG